MNNWRQWRNQVRRFFTNQSEVPTTTRIYLDYAAATPVSPLVMAAMQPYFTEFFGNAGGLHAEGVKAKVAVAKARTEVARLLQVQDSGVIFTSGGTESNNLAIIGYLSKLQAAGRSFSEMSVVTTKLEHPATLKTLAAVAKWGVKIIYAPVTEQGQIDIKALPAHLTKQVVLVTIAYVNSEIGAINDCRAVRRICDKFALATGTVIKLHVDAAQAPLWLPCDLPRLGADLISLDAGKMNGPKGCGVLAWQKGMQLEPILFGGGQELGLRPGTEPVSLLVGTAAALAAAQSDHQNRRQSTTAIRDYFLAQLAVVLPAAIINGPLGSGRVANNVHISLPGLDAEFAVITLDTAGIAASTKSACSQKGGGASPVILAITGDEARATSTLRFTLGPEITRADIDRTIQVLQNHVSSIPVFNKLDKSDFL